MHTAVATPVTTQSGTSTVMMEFITHEDGCQKSSNSWAASVPRNAIAQ